MITLYVKTGCPFCIAVQSKIAELDIEVNELNIADEGVAEALVEKGGKRQVPYLVDDSSDVSMYESGDIIEYLSKLKGGEGAAENPESPSGGVCPAV